MSRRFGKDVDIEFAERTVPGLHEWLFAKVRALPGINPESSILDLGCGTGAWLRRFSSFGFPNLVGIDRSDDFNAKAYARFVRADLQDQCMPNLGGRFDLVTAIEVVEHLSNPELLFKRAAGWLSDSGWLVVTTPNLQSLRTRCRFLFTGDFVEFNGTGDPTHLHPLVLHTYQKLIIQRHGLVVRRLATYPEQVSSASRLVVRFGLRVLSRLIDNSLPGDSLCLFIQRIGADL